MSKETNKRARKAGQGSKWCRPSTRLALYHRDGFACVYCGVRADRSSAKLTLDHVTPCELGGTNAPGNLVTACLSCNSAKGAKTARAWLAYLRAKGIDTDGMARRVRAHCARPLDRAAAGRALLQNRGGSL